MAHRALIELSGTLESGSLRRLVTTAYRASAGGEIVLVVDDAVREAVEAALDEAVPRIGLDVRGVRYHPADDDDLVRLAADAGLVVASSAAFRARLDQGGIACRSPEEGLRALEVAANVRAGASDPDAASPDASGRPSPVSGTRSPAAVQRP